jgi:hypothetical protein
LDDQAWREEKKREICEHREKLFATSLPAMKEMGDFLFEAYERARKGLPPAHWVHGRFIE